MVPSVLLRINLQEVKEDEERYEIRLCYQTWTRPCTGVDQSSRVTSSLPQQTMLPGGILGPWLTRKLPVQIPGSQPCWTASQPTKRISYQSLQHDILQNTLASKSFKFLLYIWIQDLKIQTNHAWGSISYSHQPEQKFHSLQPSSSDWHKVHGWLALLFIFLKSEYSSHIIHVYKKNIYP